MCNLLTDNKRGTERGYKFIASDMSSKNGPSCVWKLGEWKKWDKPLEMCASGFHDCDTPLKSLQFVYGDRWFITETRGQSIEDDEKSVHSEMRLVKEIDTKKVCVRFAIACAKRSLSKFEEKYPEDDRPRKAIEAAEAWLKDPTEKNKSAAESAARSAESAAESAAWSAESAAWSAESAAESAAWSAESAAWSAARSAAESAAESAAWSAARSAESAAESAARSAAESAARSAARSAAESAARSAEKGWQEKTLLSIIEETPPVQE